MTPTDLIAGTEKPRTTVDRRDFIRLCTIALASVGMPYAAAAKVARAIASKKLKPSVIWLHFQECTGCTESLLRTSHPAIAELILDLISLDYHETLLAAAGHQAEDALQEGDDGERRQVRLRRRGRDPDEGQRHLLPDRRPHGARHRERGRRARPARSSRSAPARRGAASRPPTRTRPARPARRRSSRARRSSRSRAARPTRTTCSARSSSTRRSGRCPRSTSKGRPKFAYGRTIHEHCPRRAALRRRPLRRSSSATRATASASASTRLGCKGPATHANCSMLHFGEVVGRLADRHRAPVLRLHRAGARLPRAAVHDTVDIERPTPPDTYPPIQAQQGHVEPGRDGRRRRSSAARSSARATGVAQARRRSRAGEDEDAGKEA